MICRISLDKELRIFSYAKHVVLAVALILPPSLSAAEEGFGRIIFEYTRAAKSHCISLIETPFRAAFSGISVTLVPVENLFQDSKKCYRTERRGVEIRRIETDCSPEGLRSKPKWHEIAAQLDGTVQACQRGAEVRIFETDLTLSLDTDEEIWEIASPLNSRRYGPGDHLGNFVREMMVPDVFRWARPSPPTSFLRNQRNYRSKIDDLPIQNEGKLPTGGVYGIAIDTKIAVKFGAIETLIDGDSQ